jgi:hypothetical protein
VPQNLGAEKFRSCCFPVAAQRVALRANAARGAISQWENERWVAPLCAAGLGASVDRGERRSRSRPATHCGNLVRSVAEIYRDETSDFIAGCSASTTFIR